MAYTKIITVKRRLDVSINYATNPEKTAGGLEAALDYIEDGSKTEMNLYVSAINCRAETAYEDMQATKRRWKRANRQNKGYHIIQSFAPNEVTPELAHEIGKQFAQRLLGDKYEAVVSTHLDHNHIHNHLICNSVSFLDGSMYRSTYGNYFEHIRGLSDTLCREYGLSVIEPQGKGKHYAEWKAEQTGQPTFRNTIKEDIDRLVPKSPTFKAFVINMERAGYKVRYGENIKHMKVLPPNGERYLRLSSLKDPRYTEQGIRERIIRQQEMAPLRVIAPEARREAAYKHKTVYRYKGSFKKHKAVKLHGFKALYFRYLYMLGKVKRKQYPTPKSRYMITEVQKFNRYVAQFRFLQKSNIESLPALLSHKENLAQQIQEVTEQRKPLYGERKAVTNDSEKLKISDKITEFTQHLRDLRRDYRLCSDIESDLPQVQESVRQSRVTERERTKESRKNEHRSRNL